MKEDTSAKTATRSFCCVGLELTIRFLCADFFYFY